MATFFSGLFCAIQKKMENGLIKTNRVFFYWDEAALISTRTKQATKKRTFLTDLFYPSQEIYEDHWICQLSNLKNPPIVHPGLYCFHGVVKLQPTKKIAGGGEYCKKKLTDVL